MLSNLGLVGAQNIYGNTGPGAKSSNAPVVQASGSLPVAGDKAPAYFWVTMIAVLVIFRFVWEILPEAKAG